MTFKNPKDRNNDVCADDVLETFLDAYCENIDIENDPDLDINATASVFALLYIADRLDSIDTRLMKLVKQQESRHE